jgi:hypothetical protein
MNFLTAPKPWLSLCFGFFVLTAQSTFAADTNAPTATNTVRAPIILPNVALMRPTNAIALWNGRDLTGWSSYFTNGAVGATVAAVTNGALHINGKPMGYLRTEATYSNYHLHVEWRWLDNVTNDNSGVFVHMNKPDAIWPVSVECQLKVGAAGELVGQGGVDFTAPLINKKKRAKITTPTEKPMGQWNSYDIFCFNDVIETYVNKVRQNHIEKVTVTSGGIGLQFEGYPADFRNIWLAPIQSVSQ